MLIQHVGQKFQDFNGDTLKLLEVQLQWFYAGKQSRDNKKIKLYPYAELDDSHKELFKELSTTWDKFESGRDLYDYLNFKFLVVHQLVHRLFVANKIKFENFDDTEFHVNAMTLLILKEFDPDLNVQSLGEVLIKLYKLFKGEREPELVSSNMTLGSSSIRDVYMKYVWSIHALSVSDVYDKLEGWNSMEYLDLLVKDFSKK